MSFARIEYLPFLVLVLLAWPFVPARRRALALLVASYVFYLWVRPWNALWLVASTLVDFGVGLALGASRSAPRRKLLLWTSLALNLGLLGTFKYAGWLARSLQNMGVPVPGVDALGSLVLPLGISFYTFQTLSYTIDVYKRRIEPCRNLAEYALYVSFFPQLVAGPIERAAELLPQLRCLGPLLASNLSSGGRLILWGLLKKWVVADRLLAEVWPHFSAPERMDTITALISAAAMLAVLYLDFSAYTDLARGSARLFGVQLVRNFEHPFVATSLHDWTRRWHVSLQTWITDYVHLPLLKGLPTHAKIWRANLLVMALFGLWHGARWTFLVWGLAYGVLISIEHSKRLAAAQRGVRLMARCGPWYAPRNLAAWCLTVLVAAQFIVLFFSPDLAFAARYYQAQFGLSLPGSSEHWQWSLGVLSVLLGLMAVHAGTARWSPTTLWQRTPLAGRVLSIGAAVAVTLALRVTDVRPFVYFQF